MTTSSSSSSSTEVDPSPAAFLELTCSDDGFSHRVSDIAYVAGLADDFGRCRAVCGRIVIPGSMLTAPGRRCRVCTGTVDLSARPGRHEYRWRWWRRRGQQG